MTVKCTHCNDTGDQYGKGYLDCCYCDEADRRAKAGALIRGYRDEAAWFLALRVVDLETALNKIKDTHIESHEDALIMRNIAESVLEAN